MTAVELSVKGDIAVLRLAPGDRVVITLHEPTPTEDAIMDIKRRAEELFSGHDVIIVTGGLRISGVGEEAA